MGYGREHLSDPGVTVRRHPRVLVGFCEMPVRALRTAIGEMVGICETAVPLRRFPFEGKTPNDYE